LNGYINLSHCHDDSVIELVIVNRYCLNCRRKAGREKQYVSIQYYHAAQGKHGYPGTADLRCFRQFQLPVTGIAGRYTQLLKDGFPIYSGYASGFSFLQVPPLDLQQVEIIKGSASTLYGDGAIAGIVNLISKKPTTERETRFRMTLK
jgi:hypothetical protein